MHIELCESLIPTYTGSHNESYFFRRTFVIHTKSHTKIEGKEVTELDKENQSTMIK